MFQFFSRDQGIDMFILVFLTYLTISKLINPKNNYYLIIIFPFFFLKYIYSIDVRSIMFILSMILMIWHMTTEKKIILTMGCQSYVIPSLIPICLSNVDFNSHIHPVVVSFLTVMSIIISVCGFYRYHIYKITQSIIVSFGLLIGMTLCDQNQELWQTYFLFNTIVIMMCGSTTYIFSLEKDVRHMGGIWNRVLRFYLLCVCVLFILLYTIIHIQFYHEQMNYLVIIGYALIIAHLIRLFLYIFHGSVKTSDIVFNHIKEPPLLMNISLILLSILIIFHIRFTLSPVSILTLAIGTLIGIVMFFIYLPVVYLKKIHRPRLSIPAFTLPLKGCVNLYKVEISTPIKILLSLLWIGGCLLWS
jgi:hypothetical protein